MKTLLPLCLIALLATINVSRGLAQETNNATIDGTWLPSEAQLAGQTMNDQFLKSIVLKLDHGHYEVIAESPDKGIYTVNTNVTPMTLDITGVEGPNAGRKIPAIYEFHGDTLRVCYGLGGSPRPTEFKCPTNTMTFLITYQRKKS